MRKHLTKPDRLDIRDGDFPYQAYLAGALPERVDHRIYDFTEIFDQYWLGSCTAQALVAILQYIERRNSAINAYHYLNTLFLYYKERELIGSVDYDSGAYIRDGLKVLASIGCCTASRHTTNVDHFTDPPKPEAYENAAEHKITSYHRIMKPEQLKQALYDGNLVAIGFEVYTSFESDVVARTGIVPMPDKSKETFLGGHAVAAYGYITFNGVEYIICRNSYGASWGDRGYFYLPMAFIGRYIPDMWVIK